jgi:hypothetical protein
MSSYDLIKEGYLHSHTLRWSAGGIRGRDGEWQFPASSLPPRDLLRGLVAVGFTGLTLDRYGYADTAHTLIRELDSLLGPPIARRGDRLVAWDLRPAIPVLLHGATAHERRALAHQMLAAPQIYMVTDPDHITTRGDIQKVCRGGTITLVNPGARARRLLILRLDARASSARHGTVTIAGRTTPIPADGRSQLFHVDVAHGTTTIPVTVDTPGVRCAGAAADTLPTVSARLRMPRTG